MKLTIVFDEWTEGHAIYIDGILRGEWDEIGLTPEEFFECYEQFARCKPVAIEMVKIESREAGIYLDEYGVEWPEQLGSLFVVEGC